VKRERNACSKKKGAPTTTALGGENRGYHSACINDAEKGGEVAGGEMGKREASIPIL